MPVEDRRRCGSPGMGVTEGWQRPCRCWKSKQGPPEEWQVLLTTATGLNVGAHHSICAWFTTRQQVVMWKRNDENEVLEIHLFHLMHRKTQKF